MDQAMLAQLRQQLEEDRQQQLRQLAEFGAEPYGEAVTGLGGDEGFADSAQATEERAEALAQIEQSRTRLRQVDEALARMDEGTYGTCIECGNEIPVARLEARPLSIRCLDCAAKVS